MLVALRSAKMVAMALDCLLTHSGWKERTLRDVATLRAAGSGHARGGLEPIPDWRSGDVCLVVPGGKGGAGKEDTVNKRAVSVLKVTGSRSLK